MPAESRNFDRPGFLGKGIKTEALARTGNLIVRELRNLPENVLEKVPRGYVVKEYDMPQIALFWLFPEEFPDMWYMLNAKGFWKEKYQREPTLEELVEYFKDNPKDFRLSNGESVEDRIKYIEQQSQPLALAKRLKERQEFHVNHFKDKLPDFILESQFMVGSKSRNSTPHLYEIQKKTESAVDLGLIFVQMHSSYFPDHYVKIFGEQVIKSLRKKFKEDEIESLRDQLIEFRLKAAELLEKYRYVVDIWGPFNLIITPEGKLKLVDTNNLSKRSPGDPASETTEKMLRVLDYVIRKLNETSIKK